MDFLLSSDYNYQKILINQQDSMSLVDVSSTVIETKTYYHGLGRIPGGWVWCEEQPGNWYPLTNVQVFDGSSLTGNNYVGGFYFTDNELVVEMVNFSFAPATVNIWVRVYLDV